MKPFVSYSLSLRSASVPRGRPSQTRNLPAPACRCWAFRCAPRTWLMVSFLDTETRLASCPFFVPRLSQITRTSMWHQFWYCGLQPAFSRGTLRSKRTAEIQIVLPMSQWLGLKNRRRPGGDVAHHMVCVGLGVSVVSGMRALAAKTRDKLLVPCEASPGL